MIKSSLLNYELPNSSINQEPYENPLDSKLLIAENREIIILNSITTDLFIEFPFFKIC